MTTVKAFLFVVLVFLGVCSIASGQQIRMTQTWGSDASEFAILAGIDPSGDLFLGGVTTGFGAANDDVLALRMSSDGSVLWARRWGGGGDDGGSAGGFRPSTGETVLGGSTTSFGAIGGDALLVQFDDTGDVVWDWRWGGDGEDNFDGVVIDDETGDVYAAGGTLSFPSGPNRKALVAKLDSSGTTQWVRTWDESTAEDSFNGITFHAATGALYAGGNTNNGSGFDALLVKYNRSGDVDWARTWGDPNAEDDAFGVSVDAPGNVYLWGASDYGAGDRDLFVAKWSPTGTKVWDVVWGTRNEESAEGVVMDTSGRLWAVGQTFGCTGPDPDLALLELDPATGDVLSSRIWGGAGELGLALPQVQGGELYVAGGTSICTADFITCDASFSHPNARVGTPVGTTASVSGEQAAPMQGAVSVAGTTCAGPQDVLVAGFSLPLGDGYCSPAVDNSTGFPGRIDAVGSAVVSDADFGLFADQLPVNQFGYFLVGDAQGLVMNPGGSDGNLCVVGNVGRFRQQVQSSGSSGRFDIAVDLTSLPPPLNTAVSPGETWNFQAWFRDNSSSNFTDAVSVLFQ